MPTTKLKKLEIKKTEMKNDFFPLEGVSKFQRNDKSYKWRSRSVDINSLSEVLRHALESLSENLLDFLNHSSLGGSIDGVSKWWTEGERYLEALVD